MPPQFGTSGLRGLVTDLTPALVSDYVAAFAATCPMGAGLFVAHELRQSSPDIAAVVVRAGQAAGLAVTFCGAVPTPALALGAMQAGAAAVMVTGSHIPADRNGLKFYTPAGEITKDHEAAILADLGCGRPPLDGPVPCTADVGLAYRDRYLAGFGATLAGLRVGLFAHSAVGRDLMADLLAALGVEVVVLGSSADFVPVDTEAVDPDTKTRLAGWARDHAIAAILSTDGDGDRPLMTDENGRIIPGDIMGQITAAYLGAQHVVTPVSSNSGVQGLGFAQLLRTRIGSPHVIAGMQALGGKVAGYEANGGFLLGFDAKGPAGPMPALMTRDAVLPMLAVLAASKGAPVSRLVAAQPARFTAADRLQHVPTATSAALVAALTHDTQQRASFLAALNLSEAGIDLTDGLRIICADSRIVHLRPSGNAPELRLYVEAGHPDSAAATLQAGLALLRRLVDRT
ncbi:MULTISPECIES: phosphomannomutase [unclassified Yoonia]|uniref:phosphomannomutase n=1 Tax=unclassified Yoonia TaxID=2629118 RepID=UPI002AFE7513|nr:MULTISPECIES: phosphomannomutase [unclassified Yoonia]